MSLTKILILNLNMKFVIAPDKFKGSLTGIEFCNAVEKGIRKVIPKADITKLPLSDGGDGTIEILEYHLKGKRIKVQVKDPLFRQIEASYLYMDSIKTAFIEMAEASGMKLLNPDEQNCMDTTTYGTGELILDAVNRGAKTIMLGLGGSATNDCGIGMATALGYKFTDKNCIGVSPIGKNLSRIINIDTSQVHPKLNEITFKIACDVTNPLYGLKGAAYIYGLQKGASPNEIKLLNNGLCHISNLFVNQFNIYVQNIKGAGAAGGMGAGALVFLNANLLSGIDMVKQLVDFDNKVKDADWIITGEGKLDSQTLSGKTIQGVIVTAKKQNIPVAVFCGSISLQKEFLYKLGISYAASIIDWATNLEDAMKNSYEYLINISEEFSKKTYII